MALFIVRVISIEECVYRYIYIHVQMYKLIKLYILVPMESIKCFSHDEAKKPWAYPSILHVHFCKWSLAFCTTLSISFLNSSGTFKQACTGVQLHKMENMCTYLLGIMKFGKSVCKLRSLTVGDNLGP